MRFTMKQCNFVREKINSELVGSLKTILESKR